MKKLCMIIMVVSGSFMLQGQVPEIEFQALKAFYNATGGNNWKNRTGWENINTTATANDVTGSWKGLSVENGHVTKIGMNSNNLVGYLPPQIGDLPGLKYLEVDNGKLEGTLPSEIGKLVNLEGLTLGSNRFIGPLPAEMANLVKLKYVYLQSNPLNIPFPADMLQNWPVLEIFYGSRCGFTGSLPDFFDKLPKLYMFYLDRNQMTGEIPPSFSKIKTLYEIDLSVNAFYGTLPSLDSCKALRNILLTNNQFSGSLPDSWSLLPLLRSVHIYDNNLSGAIPSGLFSPTLERFYASNNFFTFESIEPHIAKINNLNHKEYATNKLFPLKQKSLAVNAGETLTLSASALSVYGPGGNNNRYKWFRNNTEVYSGNDPSYVVAAASPENAGIYRFEFTNTVVTGMVLKSENLMVSVLVAGNKAPRDITFYPISIPENKTGYDITLVADDDDAGDKHTFFLTEGDGVNDQHNGYFASAGTVLMLKTPADFEKNPVLRFLVTANDMKGGLFTKALQLRVEDVDEAPVFLGQLPSTTIDETAPDGFTVMYMQAEDPEKKAVSFSIEAGNENGAFGISGNRLVVADHKKLSYDQKNQYTLTIKASDGTLSSAAQIVVSLSKINKMPVVENAVFTIAENSPAATIAGSIIASDPEGKPLTYAILSGNKGNAFRMTGNQVLVNNPSAVDYDAEPVFHLVVNVSDGISNIPASVTIHLTNQADETGNDILSFAIPGLVEPPVIDAQAKTIKARVENVSLGALKADFTLSKGATSNQASGTVFNFATPLTVRVTSETGVAADWQIRVTIPSAVHMHERAMIKVYPNPAAGHLYVSGLKGTTTLRLIDSAGRMLYTVVTDSSSEAIQLSGQKPGFYLLNVEFESGMSTYKVIKK